MIAEASPLLKIFEGSKQFEVPIYQRAYAWSDQDRQQLWNDVLRAGRNDKTGAHFVGSVVYIQSGGTFGSSVSKARLIDGQQRLTTVMLLMAAFTERLRTDGDLVLTLVDEDGEEHHETITADWLRTTYLLNSTVTGELSYKLLLTQSDRATLMHHLGQVPLPTQPSATVQQAMAFFRTELARPGVSLADVFMGLRKLQVVNVQLEQGKDDPQLIFESLNSTGKDLTQADLIRNYILMGLPGPKQKELYEHVWFPMEEQFKGAGEDAFDRFVRDYLTVKTRVIPNLSRVYTEFKRYRQDQVGGPGDATHQTADQKTAALVQDLAEHARLYIRLVEPQRLTDEADRELRGALMDLDALEVRVSYPFLLEAMRDHQRGLLTAADLVQLVRLVEAYVVRRAVCELKTNPLNRIFSQLGKDLDKTDYLRAVGRSLLQQRDQQRFPGDEEFYTELLRRPLYNSRDLCKAMLVRLERALSPKELLVTDTLTIEHVLPQNEDLGAPWQAMLGEQWREVQASLKHTLGNLTLTGYNSELGDLPFDKKKTLPSPKGYGSSKMLMTRDIAETQTWNAAAITARAQTLGGLALTLWAMPDLPAEEIHALRSEARKKTFSDAWQRLEALPEPLRSVFTDLAARLEQLPAAERQIRGKEVNYRKGRRYAVALSTDDHELRVWAYLGEAAGHPAGWTKGKDLGWWKALPTTPAELDALWPDIVAAWNQLPPAAGAAGGPQQEALNALAGEAAAALEHFEQRLLALDPTLTREVLWRFVRYGPGQPPSVTGSVKQGRLQIQVRPRDPDLITPELLVGWDEGINEHWTAALVSPGAVERVMPLVQAVHEQHAQNMAYRMPEIRQLVRALRAAALALGEDMTVVTTQSAERYLAGPTEIARVYINYASITVRLRHPFSALINPQQVGDGGDPGPKDWGDNPDSFRGSFNDPAAAEQLQPLLRQTYEAHRR